MAKKRMGFEGKVYWGSAGSTGGTELTLVRDSSYNISPVYGDTSDRGSLCNLSDVAGFDFELQFEVNNHDGNSFIAAARAAAVGGNAIAFVKPTVFAGGDRPGSWGIEVGYKVLGF